ncbi:MAG: Sua5/YciO/YrdC/YwlC family protein, partial [Planctomycetota bacterium]
MSSSLVRHDPALPKGRAALREALEGGSAAVVATETVPGLAVLAGNPKGLALLRALKQAPADKPFSLHPRDARELRRLLPALPPGLPGWLSQRLPGPWTVVLPRDWVALPRTWEWPWPGVGLRLSGHPALQTLAAGLPAPLLLTSVNPHGAPPLHGAALKAWLEAHPKVVVGLDPSRVKAAAPSTVVAFEPLPRLIRGSAPPGKLRPGLRVLVVCSGNICRSPLAAALLRSELAACWGLAPEQLPALG